MNPIHIWQIDLDAPASLPEDCLDETERRRAASFRSALHCRRYVAAHVALRELLGRQVGVAPRDLAFSAGEHGKPALPASFGLHFNLAHCEDLALLALSTDGELGIDVERIHGMGGRNGGPDASNRQETALALRHFSQPEVEELQAIAAGPDHTRAFFSGWTRKEAWVKATGIGLRKDLRDIDTGLSGVRRVGAFLLQPIDLHPRWAGRGFVAALACTAMTDSPRIELHGGGFAA